MRKPLAKSLALLLAGAMMCAGCSSGQSTTSTSAATTAAATEAAIQETTAAAIQETTAAGTEAAVTDDNPFGLVYAEDQTYRTLYSTEATSLHPYKGDASGSTWNAIQYLTESLLTTDIYGKVLPGLCESYEVSEDELVWTFHIRKGVHWADHEGNAKDELTAHDFVTAAHFVCNPDNAADTTYYELIEGGTELASGEETDLSTLGFKALDDYTIQITLDRQIPYFGTYSGPQPMCTRLYEELGDDYGMDNESIYYIGPYYLESFEPQTERIYKKNPHYYDAENVHVETMIFTYNAQASTLAPELFKRGEVDQATISADIVSDWLANEDTTNITLPGRPSYYYMYYYMFNFVPSFGTEEEQQTWIKVVDNENFRQSLYWGLDRIKAKMAQEPYTPEMFLSNTITPVTWCSVDGVDYVDIEPLAEITHRENWGFDEEKALEYKEKAMEELAAEGITFPIEIYMPYDPSYVNLDMETQVVKQQLEELLGTDYINIKIETGPSTGFLDSVRRSGNYAMMKSRNGASIFDPELWTIAYKAGNTWNFIDKAEGPNVQALQKEYQAMLDHANSITTHSMERYQAFAEAEAFLINHALVIPFHANSTSYMATKVNPFGKLGTMKYAKILAEPLTVEQYQALFADWQEKRAEILQ